MTRVILTRLSFATILIQRFGQPAARRTFYFDLYNRSNGLLTTFLSRVLGRERLAGYIEAIGRLMRAPLSRVPHADAIPDYHLIQLAAERDTQETLVALRRCRDYRAVHALPGADFDQECYDSLHLKSMGRRFWHVHENIRSVRASGPGEIVVLIDHGTFPKEMLEELESRHGVRCRRIRPRVRILVPLFVLALIVTRALPVLIRWRSASSPARGREGPGAVAVEFVDPNCTTGRATEPRYLFKNGISGDRLIAYVRSSQARRLRGERFPTDQDFKVVHLSNLAVSGRDLAWFLRGCRRLLAAVWRRNLPVYALVKEFEDLEFAVELSGLFRTFPIALHVYNKLPNGRTHTRHDSGIVTGVCRRHGAYSLGYQSRVYYRRNTYYFFEAFDEFCMWGDAWIREYSDPQFIRKFSAIGAVHLDAYFNADRRMRPEGNRQYPRKLGVFTADIDSGHPSHYSFDYTRRFLLDVISAVAQYNRAYPGAPFKIIFKTKDPEHWPLLRADKDIGVALTTPDVVLDAVGRARHDVESIIDAADKVIAIGFTSPCFDALGLGKPARYYTPYEFDYNGLFAPGSPVVVHNRQQIGQFLEDGEVGMAAWLDDVDPFRDGRAGCRLVRRIEAVAAEVSSCATPAPSPLQRF